MCGLIRRYGATEPTVSLRCFGCSKLRVSPPDDPMRLAAITEQTDLILDDATRRIPQPADLHMVTAAATAVHTSVRHRLRSDHDESNPPDD